jgi:hypothetical protein
LAVSFSDAWTIQQKGLAARRSSLSMNIESVATKPNIKVGVIGMSE